MPPDEVGARMLIENVERTFQGSLERSLRQPVDLISLADPDVRQVRADRRRDV